MKTAFFILLSLIILTVLAQKPSKIENCEGKSLKIYNLINEKSWAQIDSGQHNFTVIFPDTSIIFQNEKVFYMGKFEVTNEQSRTFLTDLKNQGKIELFNKYLPDSTQWNQTDGITGGPMMEYYSTHPAFDLYPVVNISFEAAQAYCEYLTKKYSKLEKKKYQNVTFRLPTEEEWVFAAGASNNALWLDENQIPTKILPWDGSSMRQAYGKQMGMYMANFKPINQVGIKDQELIGGTAMYDDGFMYSNPVGSYFPNEMNLYDIGGNVAEMTTTKIKGTNQYKVKGGSWFHTAYYCQLIPSLPYEKPSPWIGFRVLIEVIE